MIKVRPYRVADFTATLDMINAAAAYDHTRRMSEMVFRRAWGTANGYASDYGDRAAVATISQNASDNTLVGLVWWDARGHTRRRLEGWVHPDHRRRGIGTTLLAAAEAAAREVLSPIMLTARIYSEIGGGETLFLNRGFHEVRRFYVMSLALAGREFEAAPPAGVTLRTYRDDDLPALAEADNDIFTGHYDSHRRTLQAWKYEMQEARPFDPALWIVAEADNRIVGECLCHLSREGTPADAWVAIVGVREEWRGRGLGRAVLSRGLHTLQQAGFTTASLHVDGENSPAVGLYRSHGMEIARTRLHFAKTITD